MDKIRIRKLIGSLAKRDYRRMYMNDFFLTWEKSDDEIAATFLVAEILRGLREANISCRMFDSGLGISLFRDNSTRTRFSFASACNLLGLEVQDLDEGKSQIAHGETVRETANMISFMADVIGIRDDMYIGKGNAYMHTVSEAVQEGYRDGVLEQRPTLVNLQCDIDHPTQCMADMLHIINHFGGVEKLKGKRIAMSWAYSPSYGETPLRAAGRHRPDDPVSAWSVVLAHPEAMKSWAASRRWPAARRRDRRFVREDERYGRSLRGRGHRVSQELGSLRGHAAAHRALRRGRHGGHQETRKGIAGPERQP